MVDVAAGSTIERFNPLDPSLLSNPYPIYARYRKLDPVHWGETTMSGLDGAWYVFSHQDNAIVLKDSSTFANDPATAGRHAETPEAIEPVASIVQRWLAGMDPPDHTKLRSTMVKAFTPRRVLALQPRIEYITSKLLDEALTKSEGRFDVISDLSFPIPMSVIGDALGVDEEEWVLFRKWAQEITEAVDRADDPEAARAGARAIDDMCAYFKRLIVQRRRQPTDDLMSAMLAAADDNGEPMQELDAVAIAIELGVAGHETTMNSVAISVLGLMHQRDRWEQLTNEPSTTLWDAAVEEMLRWSTPVQRQRCRWATRDVLLGSREIGAGQPVVSLLGAANRDPQVFHDPDRIDFGRPASRHLTFGFGPHFCLGSALARFELRTALRSLSERAPHIELTYPDHLEWRNNALLPAPVAVWVNF
jgi:cytochrome P450 StaP